MTNCKFHFEGFYLFLFFVILVPSSDLNEFSGVQIDKSVLPITAIPNPEQMIIMIDKIFP